jgi:pyruvate,water dikinase
LLGRFKEEFIEILLNNLRVFGNKNVSVRSSAIIEDRNQLSGAGMYSTFLNIKDKALILKKIKKCFASNFNERVLTYLLKNYNRVFLSGIAVIIQEMIPADISGVTFSVNPLNKKTILTEASYGLNNIIVDGRITPDSFLVDRKTLKVLSKSIKSKNKMCICSESGVQEVDLPIDKIRKQSLTTKWIKKISNMALEIENIFRSPQDIEWSIYNNKIWLLQSRPITKVFR